MSNILVRRLTIEYYDRLIYINEFFQWKKAFAVILLKTSVISQPWDDMLHFGELSIVLIAKLIYRFYNLKNLAMIETFAINEYCKNAPKHNINICYLCCRQNINLMLTILGKKQGRNEFVIRLQPSEAIYMKLTVCQSF